MFQAWRYGCLADGLHEGTGREKSAPYEDDVEERLKAEIVAEELTKNGSSIPTAGDGTAAVAERSTMVKLACQAFGISQTCCRYEAKLDAEYNVIADWLPRLMNNQRAGIWVVLPVRAQREPLPMESQARLQNLPRT